MLFKKIIFFFSCLYCLGSNYYAQNLVPNPGFELVKTCTVTNLGQSYLAIENWFSFDYGTNSPDIYNSCFSFSATQIPNTFAGVSTAHSGSGMSGIAVFPSYSHRESISVELNQSLQQDSAYCVSFWIKNSKIENKYYWSTNVGVYFSSDTVHESQNLTFAHISSSEKMDENEWREISHYYIANGNESFLTIGYFGPVLNSYQESGSQLMYYFIDDVSVTLCNKDSLLSVVCELPNVFTVNNDNINEVYQLKLNNIKKIDIQILNRWGNVVRQYDGVKEIWDGNDNQGNPLTEGVYFVKAIAETTFGEILSKQQFVHLIR